MLLHDIANWFQPPAIRTSYNNIDITCLPYEFSETIALPELLKLTQIYIKLNKKPYQPQEKKLLDDYQTTKIAIRDAYYLSFKDYHDDELNHELIQAQIALIISLRNEYFDQGPNLSVKQKTNTQFVQKGLIKIISSFHLTAANLPEVCKAIAALINAKGIEQTREMLVLLSKISTSETREHFSTAQLIKFVTDLSSNEEVMLPDLLIKHFPKQFNENHFIKAQANNTTTYTSLPHHVRNELDKFAQPIKETILSFWREKNKHKIPYVDSTVTFEFLYYLAELQKTIGADKTFFSVVARILSTKAIITAKPQEVNQFIAFLATEGIQFCSYMLQECAERKIDFKREYVNVLHGKFQPYLKDNSENPIFICYCSKVNNRVFVFSS